MELDEFLCMVAIQNTCENLRQCCDDYGFGSWSEMFDTLSDVHSDYYISPDIEDCEVRLNDEYRTYFLSDAVDTAYEQARWVLRQVKLYKVKLEELEVE